MKKRVTLELRLRVCYDLNGESVEGAASRMANIVDYATSRGLLTDGLDSEVYCHVFQVTELKSKKVICGAENLNV